MTTTWYCRNGLGIDVFPLGTGGTGGGFAAATLTNVNVPGGATIILFAVEQAAAAPGTVMDGVNVGGYPSAPPAAIPSGGIGVVFYRENSLPLVNATITYTKTAPTHAASISAFYVTGPLTALDLDFTRIAVGSGALPAVTSGVPTSGYTFAAAAVCYSAAARLNIPVLPSPWGMPPWLQNSSAAAQVQGGWLIHGGTLPVTFAPTLSGPASGWAVMVVGFKVAPPTVGWYAEFPWLPSEVKLPGDRIRQNAPPGVGNGRIFEAASPGGTTGSTEPVWPLTPGGSVVDGSVVWKDITGSSWTAPFADLISTINYAKPGDTIAAASDHLEVVGPTKASANIQTRGFEGGAYNCYWPLALPSLRVVSADPASQPLSLAAGARVHFIGADVNGGPVQSFNMAGALLVMGCTFEFPGGWFIANGYDHVLMMGRFIGCTFRFGNLCAFAQQGVGPAWIERCDFVGLGPKADVLLNSGSEAKDCTFTGTFNPAGVFYNQGGVPGGTIEDCDVGDVSVPLWSSTTKGFQGNVPLRFRHSRLPPVVGQGNVYGSEDPHFIEGSDSGTATYRREKWTGPGSLMTSTDIYRSGGASCYGTPVAWKITTTTFAEWAFPFRSLEMEWDNAIVGSDIVVPFYCLAATIPDNRQVWPEISFYGNAASTKGTWLSGGTPAPMQPGTSWVADCSSVWNGAPGGTIKFCMSLTIRPQLVGPIRAVVKVAQPLTQLWVDPWGAR